MSKTLFDKIWGKHVVKSIVDGPDVLYVDKQYIHEVTSPQAFNGLNDRGIKVARPKQVLATADHNTPTLNQHLPIEDALSKSQLDKLSENCKQHNIELLALGHPDNGIVHIVGPELGYTQPGMTIVCGDSHTATHGAFGSIAFGIGTSEVEMVLASQCLMQNKPKTMRININGTLNKGVSAKDIILHIIAQLTASGGTGYFIEYAGDVIASLSMEARMTICNMSIEMGARGGMIAPDETTFEYLKNTVNAPQGDDFKKSMNQWKMLYSDDDAIFDKEHTFNASNIPVMITYGTDPGKGMALTDSIPTLESIEESGKASFQKALDYMGFKAGEKLLGKQVDYVFLGSCTNGRIEDFRAFAKIVKGKKKAEHIKTYIVPGSKLVEKQIEEEGLRTILEEAGFEVRQPGCSSCLAMNDDKVPKGKYCVSTSNRNFEGRQGPGSRTLLAGPIVAAVSSVTGKITDVESFI